MATDGAAIGEIRFERTDPNAPPTAFPLELLFTSEPLSIQVHPDDVVLVPAGTIHAIGPGPVIAEIQRRSDTAFRLYDHAQIRHRHGSARQGRPEPNEREGHVPNVVYTCGAIRHGSRIVLP